MRPAARRGRRSHEANFCGLDCGGAARAARRPSAQEPSTPQAATPGPASEPYEPGLGEIMALQQMRHIKLWFAGRAGNWPLADYEIDELKEGFDDVNRRLGGDTVEKAVGAQLAALEKAVAAKDRAAFASAFDTAHRGLQQLPSGAGSCLHRHPAPDLAALQQSVLRSAQITPRPRQRAARGDIYAAHFELIS